MQTDFDTVIVGGGPAGSCAALQLARHGRAGRTLLLDRARFPREKLCGGGIVRQTDRFLGMLGIRLDVPAVPIHAVRFHYPGGYAEQRAPDMFRVVRREEFDTALLRAAANAGVMVHEAARVDRLERTADGIAVHAGDTVFRAPIVIGADGARSAVRRALVGTHRQARFVALEVLTPMAPAGAPAPDDHTAVFDFRPAARGLRGYYWDFPSVRGGRPLMNRGLGGADWRADTSLRALFDEQLAERGIALRDEDLQGASAPLYDPALPQSAPHVLLAGDAVGIDPWFGEGISVAVGTGMLAGHAAHEALARGDFRFADHRRRIADSAVGWDLRRNRARARAFYRHVHRPLAGAMWFGLDRIAA